MKLPPSSPRKPRRSSEPLGRPLLQPKAVLDGKQRSDADITSLPVRDFFHTEPLDHFLRALESDGALKRLRNPANANAMVPGITSVQHRGQQHHYRRQDGGLVMLSHGSVVEGSHRAGGLQPDYLIDLSAKPVQTFIAHCETLKKDSPSTWTTMNRVARSVSRLLADKSYDGPLYRDLIAKRLGAKKNIALGEYLSVESGVCREHALLTHLGLTAAGIPCFYVYFKAKQPGSREEDHAAVAVPHRGELWFVDAYNSNFHGVRVRDVFSKRGTRLADPAAPFASSERENCRGRPLKYPTYWIRTTL